MLLFTSTTSTKLCASYQEINSIIVDVQAQVVCMPTDAYYALEEWIISYWESWAWGGLEGEGEGFL